MLLAAAGIVVSFLYTGSALATTAIGTLIPILRDSGELHTRFGNYLLGAGAIGEFGPILLITLVFRHGIRLHEALILVAFIVIAGEPASTMNATRISASWRGWRDVSTSVTSRMGPNLPIAPAPSSNVPKRVRSSPLSWRIGISVPIAVVATAEPV